MDKQYNIGFTAGVFDMFHMGHLKLIRRCKETCNYLIVGVLTDDLVTRGKGKTPIISQEDRAEILRSLKEVDEVVFVDDNNTHKPDAWQLYHFDVCYTGDDHTTPDWLEEQRILRSYGSEMVFLPYTKGISTTQIVQTVYDRFPAPPALSRKESFYRLMRAWLDLKLDNRSLADVVIEHEFRNVAIYGAGVHGQLLFKDLKDKVNVICWIDQKKNDSVHTIQDVPVMSIEDTIPNADVIIITPYLDFEGIQSQLSSKVSCPIVSLEELVYSARGEAL